MRRIGMRRIGIVLGGLVVAAATVTAVGGPAAASCAQPPKESPYAFTGTVTKVGNGDRLATVRTEDGRLVTVVGTPDENSGATTVDRTYVVGARYRFHPLNDESPYRDNACTATTQLGAAPSPSGAAAGVATADRFPASGIWLPALLAGAVAAVLIPFVALRARAGFGRHPKRRSAEGTLAN